MNAVILKDIAETDLLPYSDARAKHIKEVLKFKDGDEVFVGVVGGALGIAKLAEKKDGYCFLRPWKPLENPTGVNLTLCVAYARPQITKRIIFDAACMGVKKICFYPSEKSFAPYAKSSLFAGGLWREAALAGLSQGCRSNMPSMELFDSLEEMLGVLTGAAVASDKSSTALIAPDLYEASAKIEDCFKTQNGRIADSAVVVLGSERGFSAADRNLLRTNKFTLASMTQSVLRTDTAAVCAVFAASLFLEKRQ